MTCCIYIVDDCMYIYMYVCVSCMNIMKCKPNNTMVIYVLPYIYMYIY